MTVLELIKLLETCPKGAEVTVPESGKDSSYHLTTSGIVLVRAKGRRSYVKIVPDDTVWAQE